MPEFHLSTISRIGIILFTVGKFEKHKRTAVQYSYNPMQQHYPEFIQDLGNSAINALSENPTAAEVADEILLIVEQYHEIIEENQGEIIVEADHFDYEEVSTNIISNIMLEMIISVVARDVTEFVCESINAKFSPDDVIDEFPDEYIKVHTSS